MSLKRCTVSDLFKVSSRTITDEGYLIAPGVLARTGVQTYQARELGLDGGDKPVRLYRPPEEVFAADSVTSFEGKPITMDHPPTDVVADNWKKYAVGDVRDVKHDNGLMTGTLVIRDKAAVRAVLDGKCALSNGYSFDFDPTPGKAPDGSAYDAVQRQVRGNHTAIVDTARGGPACRIGDHEPGDRPMAMIKLALDGISIELEETQASIVQKLVGDAKKAEKTASDAVVGAEKRAGDAEAALKTATEAATKAAADSAARIAELEGKVLKPDQVQALVVERTKLVADAAKLAPEYKPEAKAPELIRSEVLAEVVAKDEALKPIVAAILKGAEPAKADPALATTAFDAAVAAKGTTSVVDAATREADRIVAGADGAKGGGSAGKLTGRALFMARQQNPNFQQDAAE
jgi:hypothetical protein